MKIYLISLFNFSKFTINKIGIPTEFNSEEITKLISDKNLKLDIDFKKGFPDVLQVLSEAHGESKKIDTWLDRKESGVGIILWKEIIK